VERLKKKGKIVPDGRLHHHRRPLESVKLLVPSNPAAVNPTIKTTFV
jgi:hypothetical protein